MALKDWEKFRGVDHIMRESFSQNLMYSIIDWLKWSSLQAGGFQNVSRTAASGYIFGGHPSHLRLVDDPNYSSGQVWEGFRSEWVWESGIEYGVVPVVCSGVYIDDVFYATSGTSGTYAHHVDFPHGRIVFDSAISGVNVVATNYSYRTVNYVNAADAWFQELMYDVYRIDRGDFDSFSSGNWDQMTRRNMPVVAINLDRRRYKGFELGSARQWIYQDLTLHILSEDPDERNQLLDVLSQQNDKTIWLYNLGLAKESGSYPFDLDYRGSPISGRKQYPDMIAPTGDGGYQYRGVKLGNIETRAVDSFGGRLHRGVLRVTVEGIL